MHLADARLVPVQPTAGGRLARYDGVICLVGDDPGRVGTTALLEACRTHHGDARSLVDKVAGIVERSAGSLPPFVVVAGVVLAGDADGLLVAAHGPVEVTARQASGPLRLGGGAAGSWTTAEVLDAAYLWATVPGGTQEPVPALVDLQRGVAPAAGFVLLPGGVTPSDLGLDEARAVVPPAPPAAGDGPPPPPPVDPAADVPAVAPPDAAGAGGSFRLVELRPAEAPPVAAPLPVAAGPEPAAPAPDAPTGAVLVEGVRCAREHFNDPRARYCAVCGIAMFQASVVLSRGPRPPLGVLVLDSGESFPLLRDRIIGREPDVHPDVVAGTADPLQPARFGPRLSRLHARIRLDGWNVVVVDEGSTNGTFVWDETGRRWAPLPAGTSRILRPGDHLAFGDLTATFETSIQQ